MAKIGGELGRSAMESLRTGESMCCGAGCWLRQFSDTMGSLTFGQTQNRAFVLVSTLVTPRVCRLKKSYSNLS